jgi:hypothetical protein
MTRLTIRPDNIYAVPMPFCGTIKSTPKAGFYHSYLRQHLLNIYGSHLGKTCLRLKSYRSWAFCRDHHKLELWSKTFFLKKCSKSGAFINTANEIFCRHTRSWASKMFRLHGFRKSVWKRYIILVSRRKNRWQRFSFVCVSVLRVASASEDINAPQSRRSVVSVSNRRVLLSECNADNKVNKS